jgi:SAM-dependent methyltransferase
MQARRRPTSAAPCDYDRDPQRFRTARVVQFRHGVAPDVHERVARRNLFERATPGWGLTACRRCSRERRSQTWSGKPLRSPLGCILWVCGPFVCLYHLVEPEEALSEAHRVLRPGGLVAVAAPSRHDSPELARAIPDRRLTFDVELAPKLIGRLFRHVEIESWDAPLLELPTRRAAQDYLIGKGCAQGRRKPLQASRTSRFVSPSAVPWRSRAGTERSIVHSFPPPAGDTYESKRLTEPIAECSLRVKATFPPDTRGLLLQTSWRSATSVAVHACLPQRCSSWCRRRTRSRGSSKAQVSGADTQTLATLQKEVLSQRIHRMMHTAHLARAQTVARSACVAIST